MSALPKMHATSSSNVESVGHDGSDLYVKFRSGGFYRYSGVPADIYAKARAAKSVGAFINAELKGKYSSRKIEEAKDDD